MKKLFIIQGIPGSGKSSLARHLAREVGQIFSTDDYFMSEGEYVFDPSKIADAHQWNQLRAEQAMENDCSLVIIDNTNTQAWEAREYVKVAVECGYEIQFIHPLTSWAQDPQTCFERNTHGVPLPAIKAMLARMEPLTVEACLTAKAPWEKNER